MIKVLTLKNSMKFNIFDDFLRKTIEIFVDLYVIIKHFPVYDELVTNNSYQGLVAKHNVNIFKFQVHLVRFMSSFSCFD